VPNIRENKILRILEIGEISPFCKKNTKSIFISFLLVGRVLTLLSSVPSNAELNSEQLWILPSKESLSTLVTIMHNDIHPGLLTNWTFQI
jgi:hypothetical protein